MSEDEVLDAPEDEVRDGPKDEVLDTSDDEVPDVSKEEVLAMSRQVLDMPEDEVRGNFYSQHNPATGNALYFCLVCQRFGAANTGKQCSEDKDWVGSGVAFDSRKDCKSYHMRSHLISKQHRNAQKRIEDDIGYKVSCGKSTEEDESEEESEEEVPKFNLPPEKVPDKFCTRYQPSTGETLYFCRVCLEYGEKIRGKRHSGGGDWVTRGVSFDNPKSRKMFSMRRHLKSKQHRISLKLKGDIAPSEDEPEEVVRDLFQDEVRSKFYTQRNRASGDTLYFCVVCRRYGTKQPGKQDVGGGDWISNGISFKGRQKCKRYFMRRHLSSEQHSKALKRKEEDIGCIANSAKPTEDDKKVTRENLCRSVQYIVDSKLPYEHLGKLAAFLKCVVPQGTMNPMGNRHHSTRNFKDLVLCNFEAGQKLIKEEINSVNTLTKQKRKCTIAIDKSTAPLDASREVIVASYMEDDGSIREVLLSAGKISDNPFDHVTRQCEAFMETTNIVAVSTDGASNLTGRHADVFTRMKADSSYSDKMIHLPDLCHRMQLLLKNTLPPWLQETLSEANTISQILTFKSPLSQKLTEMSNSNSKGKFFPVTSVSETSNSESVHRITETMYFVSMHHHLDSILKNLELLHRFLPFILDAPDLKILHDDASVVFNIVKNPVFVSNLLHSDIVFVEAARLEKMVQSPTFSTGDFIQVVDDFKTFLQSLRSKLPKAVARLFKTQKFEYSYYYYKQVYKVAVDFRGSSLDFMEGEYFQWIKWVLLSIDDYIEIPEAVRKTCEFFDVENTNGGRKVDLFRSVYEVFPVDFCCCGGKCKGVDRCSCVAKECRTFFNFCKESAADSVENGKFSHTKFMSAMLSLKTKALNLPNIYRLIEFFALLKSNQSSTERVRSVISSTVEARVGTCYLDPKAMLDMIEVMVFLQTNASIIDYEEAGRIFVEEKHSEALMATKSKFLQSKTVRTLEERKGTKMTLSEKLKRLKQLQSDQEGEVSDLNHDSKPAVASGPSPQSRRQQAGPRTSLSSRQSSKKASIMLRNLGPSNHPTEAARASPSASPRHLSESDPASVASSPSPPDFLDVASSSHPLFSSVDRLLSASSQPCLSESAPCSPASSETLCHLPAEVPPPHVVSTPSNAAASASVPSSFKVRMPQPYSEEKPDIFCVCMEEGGKSPEWALMSCSRKQYCLSRMDRLEELNAEGGNWFHWECMGFSRLPKGAWFCPKCRMRR